MRIRKITVVIISVLIIYFVVNIFYFYQRLKGEINISPKKELAQRANYSLEDCKKVDFEIKDIICENRKVKILLFNSGDIDLQGDFLGIIYTPEVQAFIGGSTEKPLKVNQTSKLILDFGKSGVINRIEVVFQPCPFSTKIIENLALSC